jgi:ketosteroid isomerase-like protein
MRTPARSWRATHERLAALFTVDGYLLPPYVPAAKGQAAIQQGYEILFRGPVKITEFALAHIEATTQGDLAYSVGTYTQRLLVPDGKTVSETGKHIAILKRIQGEWKLAYLTYNSDLPSMPCSSSK